MSLGTLADWWEAGGSPVSPEHAEGRATICVCCPENRAPRWWESAKDPIAAVIRRHLEKKNNLKMTVSTEEDLHMCRVCGCCTRLKVHVPLEHILTHTNAGELDGFPNHCWIKMESP